MGKAGHFALDAIIAAGIVVVVIAMVSSIVFAGYKMQQEGLTFYNELQQAQNHMETLLSQDDWLDLDGLTVDISDVLSCSYKVNETEYKTARLEVSFSGNSLKRTFVLEKRI